MNTFYMCNIYISAQTVLGLVCEGVRMIAAR